VVSSPFSLLSSCSFLLVGVQVIRFPTPYIYFY
jgi:hypothetical protein